MPAKHVVVWIDHKQANVIQFDRLTAETDIVRADSLPSRLHVKSGHGGSGHAAENTQYLDKVASDIEGAYEILIVGPGLEKVAFGKHLDTHHRAIAKKVVGIETVDHPSDGQLLAYARKFFHKADMMR